jgi:hypothetical protein
MESMITKHQTPLFEGSFTSMLLSMLLLLNLKTLHRVNNVFMDELFSLLGTIVITKKGNKMLVTTYKALELIDGLGLNAIQFTHALMVVCFFEAL